jgi:hypothetical protein
MTEQTYSFQGTATPGVPATNRSGTPGPLHLVESILEGRESRDGLQALGALVPLPHGHAHTPALTHPLLLDQSGQGRETVTLNGAPVTTHRNNQAVTPTPWLPMNATANHPSADAEVEPTLTLGDLA